MKAMLLSVITAALAFGQGQHLAAQEGSSTSLTIQQIGPNDVVAISVYDTPELTRTVRVGEDGYLRLPMIAQPIKAASLTPSELEVVIAKELKETHLIVDPFVTVTVAEYHSRPVSVMGAVKKPITFQASVPVTLLEALARAEGLTPQSGSEILVTRPQRDLDGHETMLVRRIPVKALIDGADPDVNVKVSGGDEIRVPEAGRIFVVGDVKRPGAFTIEGSEQMTILKALAQAEGLTQFAGKQAFLFRKEGAGDKSEIPVPLNQIMQRKSPDVPLLANDILYVPDNKRARLSAGTLEKLLLVGGGVSAALVYASVR